jgi:hypothetical protein
MSDNPFLLPPDGAKPPEKPKTPDAVPASQPDPSHYIAVPASVESATHRIERPAPQPDVTATPVAAPSEPIGSTSIADGVAEETLMAPPAVPRAWALVLPDGTRVSLDGPLLLGRDPAGIPDRPEAALLPLADTGKTVSKTHALLEAAPDGVRVRDLHSTNGVAVDTLSGRQLVTAGSDLLAPLGSTIMLGSFPLGVAAG